MSIVLGLAEGDACSNDAEIQKSALQVQAAARSSLVQPGPTWFTSPDLLLLLSQVVINCVCAPDQGLNPGGPLQQPPGPRHLAHMWQLVQNNNGIKVSERAARARASG